MSTFFFFTLPQGTREGEKFVLFEEGVEMNENSET